MQNIRYYKDICQAYKNSFLCVCVAEALGCVSTQHHHWSSEGAERHWRAAAGSGGRPQTLHQLTAPQHWPQETGSAVLQTGGERKFSFISVSILFTELFDETEQFLTWF